MAQYLVFTVKRKYDSIMYLLSATKFTCPICQYALFLSAQSQKEPTSLSTKKLASPALHVIPPDPSLRQRLRGWDCATPSPEPEMRHTKPFEDKAPRASSPPKKFHSASKKSHSNERAWPMSCSLSTSATTWARPRSPTLS